MSEGESFLEVVEPLHVKLKSCLHQLQEGNWETAITQLTAIEPGISDLCQEFVKMPINKHPDYVEAMQSMLECLQSVQQHLQAYQEEVGGKIKNSNKQSAAAKAYKQT